MEPAGIRSGQAGLWDSDRKICAVFSSSWVHSFIHNILFFIISEPKALTGRFSGKERYNECILTTERSNLVCS